MNRRHIYIVGATRGLGAGLLDTVRARFACADVCGISRPEFDLLRPKEIAERVAGFDLIFLNSHSSWGQVELLYELFERNKNRVCDIVTIGSVSADGDRKAVNRYAVEKKALDAACTQLQLVESSCRITNIKLGRFDSDLIRHIDAPKMAINEVVERIIKVVFEINRDYGIYLKNVTIDIKTGAQ